MTPPHDPIPEANNPPSPELAPDHRFFFGWLFVPMAVVLAFLIGAVSVIGSLKFNSVAGAVFIGSVMATAMLIVSCFSTLISNTLVWFLRHKIAAARQPRLWCFVICAAPFLVLGAGWLVSFALTSLDDNLPYLPLLLSLIFAIFAGWWQSRAALKLRRD